MAYFCSLFKSWSIFAQYVVFEFHPISPKYIFDIKFSIAVFLSGIIFSGRLFMSNHSKAEHFSGSAIVGLPSYMEM